MDLTASGSAHVFNRPLRPGHRHIHVVRRSTDSDYTALLLSLGILTSALDLSPDEFGSRWPELSTFPGASADAHHLRGHLLMGAPGVVGSRALLRQRPHRTAARNPTPCIFTKPGPRCPVSSNAGDLVMASLLPNVAHCLQRSFSSPCQSSWQRRLGWPSWTESCSCGKAVRFVLRSEPRPPPVRSADFCQDGGRSCWVCDGGSPASALDWLRLAEA